MLWFVDHIRENQKQDEEGNAAGLEEAIDAAIDAMQDDFMINYLLIENRAEVKNLLLTEYDEEKRRAYA